MSIAKAHPLNFLKRKQSVHWFLFGVRNDSDTIYFIEIIGNESTKTKVISRKYARHIWAKLLTDGFEKVDLKDAGAIPFHLDQRIRQWWKFVNRGFKDKFHGDDPWGSSQVEGNDPKTLSEIAEGRFLGGPEEEAEGGENEWEHSHTESLIYEEEDSTDLDGDGDIDNYWNREGAFEYASDKSDEDAEIMEMIAIDPQEKEWDVNDWDVNDCDEDEQEHDESYQLWAIEQEKRDEETELAMEKYYASKKNK